MLNVYKYGIEIKNRLILLILVIFYSISVFFCYKEIVLFLIVSSLKNVYSYYLIYFICTNITEIFIIYYTLIQFFTLQFFYMFLVYHSFIFFLPALFKNEFFLFYSYINVNAFLWIGSFISLQYGLVPLSWQFFIYMQNFISNKFIYLHFELKLNEFLNFYINFFYLCFFYFQFFIVIYLFFNCLNNFLLIKKFRKIYYFFLIFMITMLTPPDIITQIICVIVTVIFYEFLMLNICIKRNLLKANY